MSTSSLSPLSSSAIDTPGLVHLPPPYPPFIVGHRHPDMGVIEEVVYNLNISCGSTIDKSYESFSKKTKHFMIVAEFMQNIMDWGTVTMADLYLSALLGLHAFTHPLQGLFRYCKKSIDKSLHRVSLFFGKENEMGVECLLDTQTQTLHFLQIGQGMLNVQHLLPIGQTSTRMSASSEAISSSSSSAMDIDSIVPLAGSHGVGAKQLMLLCAKNEWKYQLRGTLGELGVGYLFPSIISAKVAVVSGGVDTDKQSLMDPSVLRLFSSICQNLITQGRQPLLYQSLQFKDDISSSFLFQALTHSHILFRSPMELHHHMVVSSLDIEGHCFACTQGREDLAYFSFPSPEEEENEHEQEQMKIQYVNGIPLNVKFIREEEEEPNSPCSPVLLIVTNNIRAYSSMERGDSILSSHDRCLSLRAILEEAALDIIQRHEDYEHTDHTDLLLKWFHHLIHKAFTNQHSQWCCLLLGIRSPEICYVAGEWYFHSCKVYRVIPSVQLFLYLPG